jgi:hypothetical protein
MKFLRRFRMLQTTFRLFGNPGITATAMAGSLLADLSRMGSDNAFTDLVLTAQGGLGRAECQGSNGSKESWCANIGRYTQ